MQSVEVSREENALSSHPSSRPYNQLYENLHLLKFLAIGYSKKVNPIKKIVPSALEWYIEQDDWIYEKQTTM